MEREFLRKEIERETRNIPKQFRADRVIKDVIKCVLYNLCKSEGLRPIPSYSHPKFRDTSVDLIAVDNDLSVVYAFAVDQVVTLHGVKGLNFFESSERYFITYSRLEKKVKESKFFLSAGIQHLHVST